MVEVEANQGTTPLVLSFGTFLSSLVEPRASTGEEEEENASLLLHGRVHRGDWEEGKYNKGKL